MANEKTSSYTEKTTFILTDFLRGYQGHGGTPADRRFGYKAIHNMLPVSVTVSETPSINTNNGGLFTITNQNAAITMTTNLTGSPADGELIMIRILDDGTARAITWGASFASGPGTLPTTTVPSKWLFVGLMYSSSRSKWICIATGSEQ